MVLKSERVNQFSAKCSLNLTLPVRCVGTKKIIYGMLKVKYIYNINKASNLQGDREKELINVDKILKSVLKRQMPFLIGGTITGTIMTYYYGFPFTIVVNSVIWWIISYIVNKYYWKSAGLKDQKYLLQYAMSKINSKRKTR